MTKKKTPNALELAIVEAGGQVAVTKACGVSPQAVNRWVANGRLPRTEYSGETQYAQIISDLAGGFCADDLLRSLKPSAA